jgi:hypothetical protein
MRTPGFRAEASLARSRPALRAAPPSGPAVAGRVVPAGPIWQYEDTLYCCYPCGYYPDGSYRWCCPECGTAAGGMSGPSFPVTLPS